MEMKKEAVPSGKGRLHKTPDQGVGIREPIVVPRGTGTPDFAAEKRKATGGPIQPVTGI